MHSKRHRLDRFVSSRKGIPMRQVRLLIAQRRILIDGQLAEGINQSVHQFSKVELDGELLQDTTPKYVMLYKPKGVVSATKDKQHITVTDLLLERDYPFKDELHIAGRLDFNSTGLMLLTNDGGWSQSWQQPSTKVAKIYEVELRDPVDDLDAQQRYIDGFKQGFYFSTEDITTLPAELSFISPVRTRVSLLEGRYHQIKRMFARFDNKVTELHRLQVGNLVLDPQLEPGQSRQLTAAEVAQIGQPR